MVGCLTIATDWMSHLSFTVCIVPVVDEREQEPHAIFGSLIKDVIQRLECMLAVFACSHDAHLKAIQLV